MAQTHEEEGEASKEMTEQDEEAKEKAKEEQEKEASRRPGEGEQLVEDERATRMRKRGRICRKRSTTRRTRVGSFMQTGGDRRCCRVVAIVVVVAQKTTG